MGADDRMPDRLGPYRLLDRIGEGGMGVVYLARDPGQRAVAVKVLKPVAGGEDNALRRLAREVATMRRVRSPFVAEVIDADLAGDLPYIVTRYVPGRTLDQVIADEGALRGAALAGLARGLAEALAAVHAAGVVHRDLKPSNVMLLNGSPVVIDFGIAQGPDATRLTMTGMFMGTPGYLSPEVIEGQPSSQASDVHAWGATVAYAATGRPPFGTGAYETIFYKIVNGQPDLAGAPAALLPLLAAALARDPAHRPPAVQLSALAAVLDPATLVPAPAGAPRLGAAGAQATRADMGPGERQPLPGGAALNGVLPNGPAPNGPAPNGGVPYGAAPNGVPLGAAIPGVAGLNGAGLDTILPNGVPAAGVPNGAVPGAAGRSGAGRSGAGLNGAGLNGAGLNGAGLNGVGLNGAGLNGVGLNGAAARLRPADFADVLPPVDYRAAGGPGSGEPAPRPPVARAGPDTAGRPAATASPRGHSLLAVASMVILAAVSVVLPVAGTLTSLALIAMLRAGEAARRGAAVRRSTRGARPGDVVISVLAFPWFLARSVLGLLFRAPIAAAAAALVAGITMILVSADRLPHAVAYAAGALVVFYGLGPGSGRARSQLSHLYAVVTRTRIAQAAALIAVVALAIGAAAAAVSSPSLYWPVRPPSSITQLGGAGYVGPARLLHGGRSLLAQLRGR